MADLCDSDGTISAKAEGSEEYNVEIEYAGNQILSMYCSCPYAEGGENCKHMAAVLYAWEEDPEPTNNRNAALKDAIGAMDAEELRRLLSDCCEAWDDILAVADDALKRRMHEWFTAQWKNGVCWDDELMSKYVFSTCTSEDAVYKNLEHLDGKIADCQSDYALDSLLRQKLELLEKLPDKENAIAELFEEYGSNASVRAVFAERMLNQGDADGAIALLRQNKAASDRSYYASLASMKLIDIFTQSGDTEALIAELTEYVMTFRQCDLQYIERLKDLLPESEWVPLREKLLGKLAPYLKNRLLFSEGLLRRLLDSIVKTDSVGEMDQYAAFLASDFSDEIRTFYCEYLQKSAKAATDRKMYRKLMSYLTKLSAYPGGREAARQLAAEWKQEYNRRPAMMDELQRAGY